MAKNIKSVSKAYNKTQLFTDIAENTGLSKKQVGSVFDSLSGTVSRHIRKGAAGVFVLPGLLKIKAVKKPAQPARKGVPNPFKPGTLMDIPAKPASIKVKALALKKLKEMAK